MSYVLGTDIGTGSVKAVAIGTGGGLLHSHAEAYPAGGEQDPDMLFSAWLRCVRAILHLQNEEPLCISFSSAMHGLMAVDENARPLTPLITWSDTRASAEAAVLRGLPEGENIYRHTGTPVHAMSPLCKLRWLQSHDPGLFQRAHRFISIKEYIWHRLFDEWRIDHSIASATGLFDLVKKEWYAPALQWAGIREEQLSHPAPTAYLRSGCVSSLAKELRISADVRFCIGASDGCLASLATGALKEGVAAVTIGTSGAVRTARPRPYPAWPAMPFSYILDEQTYICGGPVNNGGNVVKWLIDKFCPGWNYDQLFAEASGVSAGAEGLIFLPYLYGERAPVWNEEASASFFGIGSRHGRAHFIRAALEGVCFGLRAVLETTEDKTQPIRELQVSGGFTRSRFWLQLLADVTDKTVCLRTTADASATGAALLALHALDPSKPVEPPPVEIRIEPAGGNVYTKNFSLYQRLYPALQPVMKEANA